jgi:hypothetical protein
LPWIVDPALVYRRILSDDHTRERDAISALNDLHVQHLLLSFGWLPERAHSNDLGLLITCNLHGDGMNWEQALDIVVSRTEHSRYRQLCEDSHPDHEAYRALVISQATGEKPKYPGIATMAASAATAAAIAVSSVLQGKSPNVDQGEYDRRRSVCTSCPLFSSTDDRCQKCGCFLKLKLWLKDESCPESRW